MKSPGNIARYLLIVTLGLSACSSVAFGQTSSNRWSGNGPYGGAIRWFAIAQAIRAATRASVTEPPKAQTKTSDEQQRVTPKTVPGRNGKIAFTSTRDGDPEIYTMDADGSNQTRLTNNPYDISPKWSPDGTKIAFLRSNGFQYDIYVMNADGSNQTRLTNNPYGYEPRDASRRGSRIAFHSTRDDPSGNNVEIYSMNADGSNQTRLTNNPRFDALPEWSPDGTRIVFKSLRDNNSNIYVMNADGTGQTRLTNYTEGYDVVAPIFSPDGMRIMFSYD